MATQYVYRFGDGKADGTGQMKKLLGSKGANLAEMTLIGVPVPPGFTITTEVCLYYLDHQGTYPPALARELDTALRAMERQMGSGFGDAANPLLVSVRSGAAVSMPGMMDTILNLGLNDESVRGLATAAGGDERFAWDSYRRLIQMYSGVVLGVDSDEFEQVIAHRKKKRGVSSDPELTAADWKEAVADYKRIVQNHTGKPFPQDPMQQLWGAIGAVFSSWNNPRAARYRQLNNIPKDLGTGVNVQAMVFGNLGEDSATGVAFTRNPATGENLFYGEWLPNAQGEDVVAGIRTPLPINRRQDPNMPSLEERMPEVYLQLEGVRAKLEKHYREMQDVEFTIQNGRLWMLQTRTGKRTAQAAIRIAVEMVEEKLITQNTALLRVAPDQLDQLLHPSFQERADKVVVAKGLPASPGAAVGQVVFNAEDAEAWAADNKKVVLVRIETSPEDIGGMAVAKGILTARGGMTSHAAVVARGMGKCCVAGCESLYVDYEQKSFTAGPHIVKEGDWISLNGGTGEVMLGQVPTRDPEMGEDYFKLMAWADRVRRLKVRTNADTPHDSAVARKFGAEGIGLCRTEHMFFEGQRINWMRQMIVAEDLAGRQKALARLKPIQRGDFEGIFEAMNGLPVTIRLLDPPLHEFLPQEDDAVASVAADLGVPEEKVRQRSQALHELNPMLGHRGCRLGITYPEIYIMQSEAIFEAACNMTRKGIKVFPEVMIPLVGTIREYTDLAKDVVEVAVRTMKATGVTLAYKVGTMIEIPRACLVADEIGAAADFFSFGTNDLTQMTFGYSRDDAGRFLPTYVSHEILPTDPFLSLDQSGVGELVAIAVERGRGAKPKLKVGVCGEHGGDPASVKFFHRAGLDYVSCSPYRVPIARLAAAHAVLEERAAQAARKKTATKKTAAKKTARKPVKRVAKKKAAAKKTGKKRTAAGKKTGARGRSRRKG